MAPEAMPVRMSAAVFLALMKMTGMSRNSSFFFTARQSSKPSIPAHHHVEQDEVGPVDVEWEMSRSPLAACATS